MLYGHCVSFGVTQPLHFEPQRSHLDTACEIARGRSSFMPFWQGYEVAIVKQVDAEVIHHHSTLVDIKS